MMDTPEAEIKKYQLKGNILPGNNDLAVILYTQLQKSQEAVRILSLPRDTRKWQLTDALMACQSSEHPPLSNLEADFDAALAENNAENDIEDTTELRPDSNAKLTPVKSKIARLAQSPRPTFVAVKSSTPQSQFSRRTSGSKTTKSPPQSACTPKANASTPQRSPSGDARSRIGRGKGKQNRRNASNSSRSSSGTAANESIVLPCSPPQSTSSPLARSPIGSPSREPGGQFQNMMSMSELAEHEPLDIGSNCLVEFPLDEADSIYVQVLEGESPLDEQVVLTLGGQILCRTVVSSAKADMLLVRLRFDLHLVDETARAFELGELARCKDGTQVEIRISQPDSTTPGTWSVINCSQNSSDSSMLRYHSEQGLLSGLLSGDPVAIRLLDAEHEPEPEPLSELEAEPKPEGEQPDGTNLQEGSFQAAIPTNIPSKFPEISLSEGSRPGALPLSEDNHEELRTSLTEPPTSLDTVAVCTQMSVPAQCNEQMARFVEPSGDGISDTLGHKSQETSAECRVNNAANTQALELEIAEDSQPVSSIIQHTSSDLALQRDHTRKAAEELEPDYNKETACLEVQSDEQSALRSPIEGSEPSRMEGSRPMDHLAVATGAEKQGSPGQGSKFVDVQEFDSDLPEKEYSANSSAHQKIDDLDVVVTSPNEIEDDRIRDDESLGHGSCSSVLIRSVHHSSILQSEDPETSFKPIEVNTATDCITIDFLATPAALIVEDTKRLSITGDEEVLCASPGDELCAMLETSVVPEFGTDNALSHDPSTKDCAWEKAQVRRSSIEDQEFPDSALCETDSDSAIVRSVASSITSSLHASSASDGVLPVFDSLLKVDLTPGDALLLRPAVVTCFFVFTFAQALSAQENDSMMDVDICGPDNTAIIMARVDDESVRWETRVCQKIEDGMRLQSVRMPYHGFQVGQAFCLVINCTLRDLATPYKFTLPSVRICEAGPMTEEVQLARIRYPLHAQLDLDDICQWTHVSEHKDVSDRWKFRRINRSGEPSLPMQLTIASLPILVGIPDVPDFQLPYISQADVKIRSGAEDFSTMAMVGTIKLDLRRTKLKKLETEPLLRMTLPERYSIIACQVNSSPVVCFRGLENELVLLDTRKSCTLTNLQVSFDFVLETLEKSMDLENFYVPSFPDTPISECTLRFSRDLGQAKTLSVLDRDCTDLIGARPILTEKIRISNIPRDAILRISYRSATSIHNQAEASRKEELHASLTLKRLTKACFVLWALSFSYVLWQLATLELEQGGIRNALHNRTTGDYRLATLIETLRESQQDVTNHIRHLRVESCPVVAAPTESLDAKGTNQLDSPVDSHDLGLASWSIKNTESAVANAVAPMSKHVQVLDEVANELGSQRSSKRRGFEIDPSEKMAFRQFLSNLFWFN